MDFYISVYTLKKLENVLDNYKKKILKDFYDIHNLTIDYQTYENLFLERKIKKPFIRDINIEKCNACVWRKNYGKVQCSNSKTMGQYCKKHYEKQNYGSINN